MADEEVHFEPANLDDPLDRSAESNEIENHSWIDKLITDTENHFRGLGIQFESVTYSMVVHFLTVVEGKSAGPDSLMDIKWTLLQREQAKKVEA
jgi:hypothetical protein